MKKAKCIKCGKELVNQPIGGFDVLSILSPYQTFYCKNKKCEHFGVVTLAKALKKGLK